MAGRRSEIAVINGAVPVAAASVGLEAPMNATVTALIMAREAAFK
jgi:2-dehydropantoate 2-reductase